MPDVDPSAAPTPLDAALRGVPVTLYEAAPQGGGRTFTSASYRQGVLAMGTELGGGGLVTPASLKVAEDGMEIVL